MHKGFKDAYHRSNKVDATSQIVTTYTRDHTFAMKDLAIKTWSDIRQGTSPTLGVGMQSTKGQTFLKLKGKIDSSIVSNLVDLGQEAGLKDLQSAMRAFLTRELNSDVTSLLNGGIRAYRALEIPVPKLSGQGFVIHNVRCTGLKKFRGGVKRNDWVWTTSDNIRSRTFNGRLPGRLNALFKLRSLETVYRLAHVTPLQFLGGATVQSVEGMPRVGWRTDIGSIVVRIALIEGMAHLIPLESEKSWLVNNRIDLETWNIIHD